MGTEQCAVVVFLQLKSGDVDKVVVVVVGGGGASSAWHINQMGPPYRSDVWAWAQSSVRWWSFQSRGGACSCRFLVDDCLQIQQTQRAPENANRANMESAGGGTV